MTEPIYLDYAAATPLDSEVLSAMEIYLSAGFYNPSATYLAGRAIRQVLEAARADVAAVIGAKPAEIIFTAGATEANNLAIQGVMKQYPKAEVIVAATEHESVLAPAKLFKFKLAPVKKDGTIDLPALQKLITSKTVLVSVGLVNNETGAIQPIKEISGLLRQISTQRSKNRDMPLYFHTDAAQAPCYLDLHVSRLGIDLLTINGGKMYGPKQTGALYVRAGTKVQPLIVGGGQENGLRSGSENVANYVGLAAALKKSVQLKTAELKRVGELRKLFIDSLAEIKTASINGSSKHSAPHIVNVTFIGTDNERLMMQLDEVGVQTALGSACSASNLEPSHVLKAMGLTDKQIQSSLRFSFGRQTTKEDINKTVKLLKSLTAATR